MEAPNCKLLCVIMQNKIKGTPFHSFFCYFASRKTEANFIRCFLRLMFQTPIRYIKLQLAVMIEI